jgi:hypothetical protein
MKVPAIRVEVNGELVAIAGAEDLSLLSGSVGFASGKGETLAASTPVFSIMGLAVQGPQPRHLTWGNDVCLKLGDRVTFELVETENPTAPNQTLSTPSSDELAAQARADKAVRLRRT